MSECRSGPRTLALASVIADVACWFDLRVIILMTAGIHRTTPNCSRRCYWRSMEVDSRRTIGCERQLGDAQYSTLGAFVASAAELGIDLVHEQLASLSAGNSELCFIAV